MVRPQITVLHEEQIALVHDYWLRLVSTVGVRVDSERARRLAQGFALDDITIGLGETARVGPGGNFLTQESTLRWFRQAYYQSRVSPQLTLEAWQAQGCPQAMAVLRGHTRQLLAEAGAPPDHAELIARGEAFILARQDARQSARHTE